MQECQIKIPHSYFVAEVIGVPDSGKVFLLYMCTCCGHSECKEFTVAKNGEPIRLLKEEKHKNKGEK